VWLWLFFFIQDGMDKRLRDIENHVRIIEVQVLDIQGRLR
jgi:hypothetical protein